MARRQLAGRDAKIIQGHRRDAFFKKMRQKGGVPRLPTQGVTETTAEDTAELSTTEHDVATAEAPEAATADQTGASAAEAEEPEEARSR